MNLGNLAGTSNADTFTALGLPTFLQPATLAAQECPLALASNGGALVTGAWAVVNAGSATITFNIGTGPSSWTASGTKAVTSNISYLLN